MIYNNPMYLTTVFSLYDVWFGPYGSECHE